MSSATIKLFLVYGDPTRLRTAELSNWTGKAVAGPRSEFDGVFSREESGGAGVYFLTGSDPESGKPAIYIGETESIRDRIKVHLEKDFWNQIIFFISKDENLTKAHIRFLEGKLIDQAQKSGRAVVTNGQSSGARLPESDRADMEVFLEKINQLLPVLGVELLVPIAAKAVTESEHKKLFTEIKGIKAEGHLAPNGFVVLKGSQAILTDRASSQKRPWVINMRQRLKDEGVLETKDGTLIFIRDAEFTSPSSAVAVIHGGQVNGLIAWKYKNGKTLKDIESL